jgi:hypothetical protein
MPYAFLVNVQKFSKLKSTADADEEVRCLGHGRISVRLQATVIDGWHGIPESP